MLEYKIKRQAMAQKLLEKEERERQDALLEQPLSPVQMTEIGMLEQMSADERAMLSQRIFKNHEITMVKAMRTSEQAGNLKENIDSQLKMTQELLSEYHSEVAAINGRFR